MDKIFGFLTGYRSYLVALIAAILGLTQALYPEFVMPDWAAWILAALGLGAVRAAIPPKE